MQKSITAVLALAGVFGCTLAYAQGEVILQENAPDRYIVEKGDTLWGIARKFLKDPWRWQDLWKQNEDQIRNPKRIYPGDVIVLDRGRRMARLEPALPTVKLGPQVRTQPLAEAAIPAIRRQLIEPFLSQPLVIEEGGLARAPRIVSAQESRVHLGPGGIAYVSGFGDSKAQIWQVYRPGKPLIDPNNHRTLDYEAVYLGTARVTRPGEPATVTIISSKQEITQGDRLIAAAPPGITEYIPHAPAKLIRGRIIGLYDGLVTSEGGRYSIVSLNRGIRDGLEPGHVLALYRTGAEVPDPQSTLSRDRAPKIRLPDERYGGLSSCSGPSTPLPMPS